MNSYKCHLCKKSLEQAITMSICFVCERIYCKVCNHTHNTFIDEDEKTFRQFIMEKGKITNDIILSFYDCDMFGHSRNINYDAVNINELKNKRRKFLKYCIEIKCHGIGDYKAFHDDLFRLKMKFKYRLYKMLL